MHTQKTMGIGMFGTTGWRRFKANDEIKKWANAVRKFAAWQAGANAPSKGRIIAYFWPELNDIEEWPTL